MSASSLRPPPWAQRRWHLRFCARPPRPRPGPAQAPGAETGSLGQAWLPAPCKREAPALPPPGRAACASARQPNPRAQPREPRARPPASPCRRQAWPLRLPPALQTESPPRQRPWRPRARGQRQRLLRSSHPSTRRGLPGGGTGLRQAPAGKRNAVFPRRRAGPVVRVPQLARGAMPRPKATELADEPPTKAPRAELLRTTGAATASRKRAPGGGPLGKARGRSQDAKGSARQRL